MSTTLLIMSLAELAVLLLGAFLFVLWKWLGLRRRTAGVFTHWEQIRQVLEAAAGGLAMVEREGSESARHKKEYVGLLLRAFRLDLVKGLAALKPQIEQSVQFLDRLSSEFVQHLEESRRVANGLHVPVEWEESQSLIQIEPTDLETTQPSPAQDPLTPLPSEGYHAMLQLVNEQDGKLRHLEQYKQALVELSAKFHRVNVANHKLLEYVRGLAGHDEHLKPLNQLLEKFQNSGAEMDAALADLETRHHQAEPKMTALELTNQQFVHLLTQYRRQIDRVLEERMALLERAQELESKLQIRNKSYGRLHSKFEALRREYIILYERCGTVAQSRGPISSLN